jgi:hypothetical protein
LVAQSVCGLGLMGLRGTRLVVAMRLGLVGRGPPYGEFGWGELPWAVWGLLAL